MRTTSMDQKIESMVEDFDSSIEKMVKLAYDLSLDDSSIFERVLEKKVKISTEMEEVKDMMKSIISKRNTGGTGIMRNNQNQSSVSTNIFSVALPEPDINNDHPFQDDEDPFQDSHQRMHNGVDDHTSKKDFITKILQKYEDNRTNDPKTKKIELDIPEDHKKQSDSDFIIYYSKSIVYEDNPFYEQGSNKPLCFQPRSPLEIDIVFHSDRTKYVNFNPSMKSFSFIKSSDNAQTHSIEILPATADSDSFKKSIYLHDFPEDPNCPANPEQDQLLWRSGNNIYFLKNLQTDSIHYSKLPSNTQRIPIAQNPKMKEPFICSSGILAYDKLVKENSPPCITVINDLSKMGQPSSILIESQTRIVSSRICTTVDNRSFLMVLTSDGSISIRFTLVTSSLNPQSKWGPPPSTPQTINHKISDFSNLRDMFYLHPTNELFILDQKNTGSYIIHKLLLWDSKDNRLTTPATVERISIECPANLKAILSSQTDTKMGVIYKNNQYVYILMLDSKYMMVMKEGVLYVDRLFNDDSREVYDMYGVVSYDVCCVYVCIVKSVDDTCDDDCCTVLCLC